MIVAPGVLSVAGWQVGNGDTVHLVIAGDVPTVDQSLGNQMVALDSARLGAMWAEAVVSTVQSQNGLAGRPVLLILRYCSNKSWHVRASHLAQSAKAYLRFWLRVFGRHC